MISRFREYVFSLYEQPRLRNWFYTLAFAIAVPTGFRFATLAWEYGDWFDKPLAVVAGAFIGATAVVTLLRIWKVPPRKTVTAAAEPDAVSDQNLTHPDVVARVKYLAARNRQLARDAASLGSTRR
jgi:hypothetical protein